MVSEIVLWGKMPGDKYEQFIATRKTLKELQPAIDWAKAEGFITRISDIDLTKPPDFIGTINI